MATPKEAISKHGKLWHPKDEEALRKIWPLYMRGETTKEQLIQAFERTWKAIDDKRENIGLVSVNQAEQTRNAVLANLLKQAVKI